LLFEIGLIKLIEMGRVESIESILDRSISLSSEQPGPAYGESKALDLRMKFPGCNGVLGKKP